MFRYFNYILPTSKPIPLSALEMEVFPPSKHHSHTIIFLHGRDDTASQFASSLFESQTSDGKYLQEIFASIKWVFPQAPLMPSERFGLELSQWFDMWSTEDPHDGENEQDPTTSIDAVHKIIAQEEKIIGAGNIILGGISQGCAIGIHALLKQPFKLGGFVGIAGWLPRPSAVASVGKRFPYALDTPVLLQHNRDDAVIDVRYGEELRGSLSDIGMEVEWRAYGNGGHWINEGRWDDGGVDEEREIGGVVGDLHAKTSSQVQRPGQIQETRGAATEPETRDLPTGVDHIVEFLEQMICNSNEGRRVWESKYEEGISVPATRNGEAKLVRFK